MSSFEKMEKELLESIDRFGPLKKKRAELFCNAVETILSSPYRDRLVDFVNHLEDEDRDLALIVLPGIVVGFYEGLLKIKEKGASEGDVILRNAAQKWIQLHDNENSQYKNETSLSDNSNEKRDPCKEVSMWQSLLNFFRRIKKY